MTMVTKYFPPVRVGLLATLSMLLLLTLAACGADNTPTMTIAKTTAAATPTTAGSGTPATGTASATGQGDFTGGKFNLPGTTFLTVDPSVQSVLIGLLSSGATAPDLALQIYASDNETPVLGENADAALVKAGYVFHDVRNGSDTKLVVNGEDGAGAYTKAGGADIVLYARDSGALVSGGTPPGVDATKYQALVNQIQGKKSVLILLSGTNLFQSFINNASTPVPTK